MSLNKLDVVKAVRSNPYYAQSTGWRDRFQQVSEVLGFRDMSPGPEAFAEAVYRWQRKNPPLAADGMLGPKSWRKMEPQTRYTPDNRAAPRWVRQPSRPRGGNGHSMPAPTTGIWFGLGVVYGGHWVILGPRTSHAWLFSLDTYEKHFVLTAESWRIGPGLGGGFGLFLCFVTSLDHPSHARSMTRSGWDLTVKLGPHWSSVARSMKRLPAYQRAVTAIQQSERARRFAPVARNLLRLGPDEYDTLRSGILGIIDASRIDPESGETNIFTHGLPLGKGIELSGGWEFGNYRVESMSPAARGR